MHTQVGLALGGLPSARLLRQLGMQVSGDTILRTLSRSMAGFEASRPDESPREIGIDDWAYRRGHHYGTIVVDLERQCPIELLPDRDTATVTAWLKKQPNVRVVTRDRASAYVDAVRQGAPQAMQVADRWHLLKNLGEAMERLLTRLHQAVRDTANSLAGEDCTSSPSEHPADPPVKERTLSQQRRSHRLARYEEVIRQSQQGMSISAIAKARQFDRQTVRRWLRADGFPERTPRSAVPGKLTHYLDYLRQRWNGGCHNGALLLREITDRGYQGSSSILRKLITQWRRAQPIVPIAIPTALPSPRCLSAWLLGRKYQTSHAPEYRAQFVETLCRGCPPIASAQRLANNFVAMLAERQQSALPGWLQKARASGPREMRKFADGLERDLEAVQAAVGTRYSNGIVEGHVNRLKMIKRQKYGRASLALLRIRVLHGGKNAAYVT